MRWAALTLLLLLATGAATAQESEGSDANGEAAVEEALELRRRLEALLGKLSSEERAEFERRWAEGSAPPAEPIVSDVPELAVGGSPSTPTASQATPAPAGPEGPVAGKAAAPPTPEEPAEEPAAAPAAQAPPDAEAAATGVREHSCNTLHILDSNGDGWISGTDRFWRYLSLWSDNGNGVVETSEVKSLFKHRIRKVSARLYSYTTVKDADGGIWLEERVYFDLPGKGSKSRAALTLDAGGLARSDDTWVEDALGNRLDGLVVVEGGVAITTSAGGRHLILCP